MSEEARELAVEALERLLALTHPAEGGSMLAVRLGILDAFSELGVLDADAVGEWRSRFERAARALEPVSAEVHARAVELLERELANAATEAERPDPLGRRERFLAKLQALLETGSIGWDERSSWDERLDEVVPDTPRSAAAPTYDGAELQAVVVGPERRLGGLRVSSAEVYDDCVIVRWHLLIDEDQNWRSDVSVPDHANDLAGAHGPRSLEDDLGTEYLPGDRGSFGMWSVLHLDQRPAVLPGSSAFSPGPPLAARRLLIKCPAGAVELDLERAAR